MIATDKLVTIDDELFRVSAYGTLEWIPPDIFDWEPVEYLL